MNHISRTHQLNFFACDANSYKLKVDQTFLVGYDQKWVWPVWLQDSKIGCISRMNRKNDEWS